MITWKRRNFLKASILSPFLVRLGLASPIQSDNKLVTIPEKCLSESLDLSLLLHCIAQVETGNDDTKVGRKGERSRYQISPTIWKQHTAWWEHDSIISCRGALAHSVALRHVRWLDNTIPHASIMETHSRDYVLAWAWHGGLRSWTHNLNTTENNNYAVRVSNLYYDAARKQE